MSANEIDRDAENEASRFLKDRKASRKPEAAPSDTDLHEAIEAVCNKWSTGAPVAQMVVVEIREALLSRTSQPVQVPSGTDREALIDALKEGRLHVADGEDLILDREGAEDIANVILAAGFSRTSQPVPSDTDREATQECIADTLAYYECRRNNPKADHPRMGYHAFSEDQRRHLREAHGEAAAEVTRIIFESRGNAWDEGAKAMARAIAEEQTITYIAPHNPFRRASQPVQVEVTEHKITQRMPWPPSPDSSYMLSLFECSCGWKTNTFKDTRDNRATIEDYRQHAEAHAAPGGGDQ